MKPKYGTYMNMNYEPRFKYQQKIKKRNAREQKNKICSETMNNCI